MADRIKQVSIVMQQVATQSRWQPFVWRPFAALLPDAAAALPPDCVRYDNLELRLFTDEAEGYFLNMESPAPCVFISIRQDDGESEPRPFQTTVSYNEAARWMDGGERVEQVPLPEQLVPWLAEFTQTHYKPEPKKKRIRGQSFESKEARYADGLRRGDDAAGTGER